jgi:outer membrane protein TolC
VAEPAGPHSGDTDASQRQRDLAGQPGYTHRRRGFVQFSVGGSSLGLPGTDLNTYQIGLDASWELDLFGKTRRSVEAARDSTGAQIWSQRDTEVSLTAEVANTYFGLREAQWRQEVARRELERQRALLGVVRARANTGFATGLDVAQQETQVTTAQAALSPLQVDVQARLHTLGVLLGEVPEAPVFAPVVEWGRQPRRSRPGCRRTCCAGDRISGRRSGSLRRRPRISASRWPTIIRRSR